MSVRVVGRLAAIALIVAPLTACLQEDPPPSCDESENEPTFSASPGPGSEQCEPPPPPEPCDDCPGAFGDPHLRTFDEVRYDLQAAGELTLVRAGDLEVQVRLGKRGRYISVVTGVAMNVDGSRFTLTQDPTSPTDYVARRDGQIVELSQDFSVLVGDGRSALTGPDEIVVEWGDGSRVTVVTAATSLSVVVDLTPERRELADGLLGTANGDPTDDLRTSGGESFEDADDDYDTLYGSIAESWRVSDATSLFDYDDGESTETYTDREFPGRLFYNNDLSDEDRSAAEAICRAAGVTDPWILDSCILDVGATGDPSFADIAADMQGRLDLGAGIIDQNEQVLWVSRLEGLVPDGLGEVFDGAGHVLVHARDSEERQNALVALDVASGSEAWRVAGVDRSCPAVPLGDGRIAVVGDARGPLADTDFPGPSLVVLDAADGTPLGAPGFADDEQVRFDGCAHAAQRIGTTVAYTNGRTVWGWDVQADTPRLAWAYQGAGNGMRELAAAGGRYVWAAVGADRESVDAVLLEPDTGAVLDQVTVPGRSVSTNQAAIVGTSATPATVVLTTIGDSSDEAVVATMIALRVDSDQLEVAWTRVGRSDDDDEADDIRSLTLSTDAVIGHANSALFAFDLDDGAPRWAYDPPGFRNTSAPGVIFGDEIFLDGIFGGPFLITVGPDGTPLGSYDNDDLFGQDAAISSAITFGPVIDGTVIVGATTQTGGEPVVVAIRAPG